MISLLVAHDINRVIGKDNELPWHIPEDLKYFKQQTIGKGIVMGRKTYESIGRPLPNRTNIVVTRQPDFEAPGITVTHSLDEAIRLAADVNEEVMIIGGAEIFQETLSKADRLYVTRIEQAFDGDTVFPAYSDSDWRLVSDSGQLISADGIPYTFLVYERAEADQIPG
ncbi:dihydrofolate reductase [Planococcus lenghuensis]|uniref:Dihydrofolate reductase n=1 Tax=Planococcus lenghuensis TaxID=2213202 RepID=A0A1Q2KZA4_9BACL|nr:dihydrofolate reductase [Planococcus lenghuensis]AQQ53521.1 dihydrofolate reductase [Planococcus lenghuensis]